MNINLSLGIISFVVWSAFSTWYYVNYVKDFSEDTTVRNEKDMNDSSPIAEEDSIKVVAEPKMTEKTPIEIDLKRNFQFKINSTELLKPSAFYSFYDSLQRVVGNSKATVKITGHACDLGSDEYNMKLSEARANEIANLIRNGEFAVSSINYKGEEDPLLPNTSESNRAKNRRVQLQFKTK